jgi:hypothetical protein
MSNIVHTNDRYKILTTSGYESFYGIRETTHDVYYKIIFKNKKYVKCSYKHPFIKDNNIIHACDLKVNDYIDTIDGNEVIEDIILSNELINLYDLIDVGHAHTFLIDNWLISHNCSFLSSGNTVLEPEILGFYDKKVAEPIEKRGIGGDLWIWKYPDVTHSYIVSADVARGDGEDYSGAIVLDVETCEQVAEYKGKIDTQAFGRMLVSIATEYNSALLIIDNKNIGWSTVQIAIDLKYPNLYYSYKNDPFLDENIHLRRAYDMATKDDMVPGLTTTTRIRPVLVSKLENYFRDFGIGIYSRRLLNELKVFVWIGGKPQAQRGYNDDLVMALAMALYVRDTSLRLHQMGIDLTRRAIQGTRKSIYKPENIMSNQWEMNIGNRRESIKWLISK